MRQNVRCLADKYQQGLVIIIRLLLVILYLLHQDTFSHQLVGLQLILVGKTPSAFDLSFWSLSINNHDVGWRHLNSDCVLWCYPETMFVVCAIPSPSSRIFYAGHKKARRRSTRHYLLYSRNHPYRRPQVHCACVLRQGLSSWSGCRLRLRSSSPAWCDVLWRGCSLQGGILVQASVCIFSMSISLLICLALTGTGLVSYLENISLCPLVMVCVGWSGMAFTFELHHLLLAS